ncbi:MAG TPA: HAD-IIIC family phosphatase [Elainellaceae cyanobacterium]
MTHANTEAVRISHSDKSLVKCVVWDLDNTLWKGVLLEDDQVYLDASAVEIVKVLDDRGILHSIASKNDYTQASAKLEEFGLLEYFLYPQIHWNSKVSSLEAIAQSLNIGLDALAFIDDQPFELDEVAFSLPAVRCINAESLPQLLEMPEMNPRFISEDSKLRRQFYVSDLQRRQAEEQFSGSQSEFLATLDMVFNIAYASESDLRRAEELTLRTNQLNTTGYTYSYDELNQFRKSPRYKLLITSLDDRYGSYGKVGLALVECQTKRWIIKLLLMSCRVISRGVGTVLLSYIMRLAKDEGCCLYAEFLPNNRNRMMQITYRFAGFREVGKTDELVILENDLKQIQPFPNYVRLQTTLGSR